MKNVGLVLLGVAGGFVAAHMINKDPRGHEVLEQVDASISAFTDRVSEAYRQQDNDLNTPTDAK